MDDPTTIEVEKDTRTRLRTWKSKHDMTYEDALNHLLDLGEAVDELHETDDLLLDEAGAIAEESDLSDGLSKVLCTERKTSTGVVPRSQEEEEGLADEERDGE